MIRRFLVLFFKKEPLFLGLVLPFILIVPPLPLLSRLPTLIWGMPIEVAWLFACIPLTSLCLALCWVLFDRHRDEDGA